MKRYIAKVRKEITGYVTFNLEEGESLSTYLDNFTGENVEWELYPYIEVEYILDEKTGEEIMDYSITG